MKGIPEVQTDRYRRWVGTLAAAALGGELSRIFLRPVTDEISCFLVSMVPFGSLCRSEQQKLIEKLARQVKNLQDEVERLKEDDLDALLVRPNKNLGNWRSPSLGSEVTANYELLNITMKELINEIETIYTQSLCSFRQRDKWLRQGFRYTLILNNVTSNYRRIAAELEQRRISLATLSSLLHDAMSSLVHGYIPISLLPPEVFVKILDKVDKGVSTEAIPRSHVAAYYTFELVKDAYVSENGLHILIEIPLYVSNGLHRVFRATAIPQPIKCTQRATVYELEKTHIRVSWDKSNFAEVHEEQLSTHCRGSQRLRLCKQPFATSRSQKTTCLTGLYFNLPATVLKL